MRKLIALLALSLAWSGVAYADGINSVVSATTVNPRHTVLVFNDDGATLTSGTVVAWDDGDTDFTTTMYPYVTRTTTADDPWTAGVMLTPSCPDQSLCEIVVYGPAPTLCADSTDAVGANTLVGSTTVTGQCGDYTTGANTCSLGMLMIDTGSAADGEVDNVFVNVTCQNQ